FQTAEHLKPKDLLMLARTCKTLRQCLMERNSAVIWRTARRNVKGLPEPPSYLSEPAYATFIFERRCYVSSATFWRFAVRYCSKCRDKMYMSRCVCILVLLTDAVVPGSNLILGKPTYSPTKSAMSFSSLVSNC
ncbi:hypothetical protein L227DRAFT_506584, partial [Lentinus tigrinus ALCF2SS1-6]